MISSATAGTLRPLATSSAERLANYPQVPTIAETFPGVEYIGWFMLVAPAGTPDDIVTRLNAVLRGWFEYFKHARGRTFPTLDGWVRMRLRSILRRHHRKKGAGRGWSNIRWPKVYFAKLGLFTMTTARASARQSLQRAH